MRDIRCGRCNKKLAEGFYLCLTIKCSRCGTLNQLRAESPTSERQERPKQET
ncbi:Com family DNA-binding transcriptional regulator [Undibacterium sp. TJN25]|uniref:Com family DNA-binding transcriptional regulator n=1 Tax=Undibacterium sp. TJN25 TaxID=3413056 RepID=UPI003BF27562